MPLGFLTQPEEWGVLHHRDYHHVSGGFWVLGFPGGTVDKNLPANAGNTCSIPGLGKIPHAAEQLSLCATTAEACVPRAHAPQQERPPR